MQLLPVVAGAIVPHAPLLLPELESPEVADAARSVREAVRTIDFGDADLLVVVSPHGPETGAYEDLSGDLSTFGVDGVEVNAITSAVPGLGAVKQPVDHGVLVPLRLLSWNGPVAGVCFAEEGGVRDVVPVERAISSVAERVGVVVSANLSAGLTPRAPLTEIEGAAAAEKDMVEALRSDVGSLLHGARALPGSCSASTLMWMGRLFGGRAAQVLAHEWPVGVGYLVAEVS